MARPDLVGPGQVIASSWGNNVVYSLPPIGTMIMVPADTLPITVQWDGWLLCDGTQVSKTLYPDLFAMCGLRFNRAGDDPAGSLFRIPDMKGKYPIGRNPGGAYFAGTTGQTGGTADANTIASHVHGGADHLHGAGSLSTSYDQQDHNHTIGWGEIWQQWPFGEDNVDSFRIALGGGDFSIVIHKFNTAAFPTGNENQYHTHFVQGQTAGSDRSLNTAEPLATGTTISSVTNMNLPPTLSLSFAVRAL